MATRRINTGLTAETAAQVASRELQEMELEADVDQTPAERIMAMLPNFSDSERSSVKLYRITGPNKYVWLDDYSCEDFEAQGFNGIRNQWGAGEYQVRLYATMPGDNAYCVRVKENIQIEASKNAIAPVVAQQQNELASVLSALVQGQQKMLEALSNRPVADPMADMMKMLSLASAMREAFMPKQETPQKSNLTEILETMRELRAVSEEINPPKAEAADPDNPMTMLPSILELVKTGMQQRATPQTRQYPPVALPPANPSHLAPSVLEPLPQHIPEHQENEEMKLGLILELKKQLAELVVKATANADIQESAAFLYDGIPDELIDALFEDDWWVLLSGLAPEVIPHQEWFAKVRDATLPMFDDGDDQAPISEASALRDIP